MAINDVIKNCIDNDAKESEAIPKQNELKYCTVCKPNKEFFDACPYLGESDMVDVGVKKCRLVEVYFCNYEKE